MDSGRQVTFDEWLTYGVENKFCTEQFCETHDGYPMHPSEAKAWEEGYDFCVHMVRLGSLEDWDVGESTYWES
jgi:hypothetical protein